MTLRASRAQAPGRPAGPRRRRGGGSADRRTGSASTRRPSTPSSAGSTVSAATTATSTAAIPPAPIERRNTCGKISSPDSETATVSPDTATVRPAVAMVRTSAARGSPAGPLLPVPADHEQAVVDRQPHPEDRHHVDREDRDLGEQRHHPQRGERAQDRDGPDRQRQAGRDHAAEHDHQQHQQDRHGQRLGPGDVRADPLVDVPADRGPPPTWVSRPGAASPPSIRSRASVRCCSSPRKVSTAYVACRSALTSPGAGATSRRSGRPRRRGSAASVPVTARRNAASATVRSLR